MTTDFEIEVRGSFSLAQAKSFLGGFAPLDGAAAAATTEERLMLAFLLDGTYAPVGVTVREREGGMIVGRAVGSSDARAVARQVARILSIDHDGTEYDRMAERDTPIGALMRAHRGFRPVCFYSPYEAAVGAVLGQRMPIRRAAVLRRRLAETAGTAIDVAGEKLFALPAPDALLGVRAFDGLPREKLARLHEVARAVERGVLDAERLRAMPTSEALASLRSIRGIGNWSAEHILMRGTGATDALPIAEPRVAAATAIAYADDSLARDQDEFVNIARQWRPFRMWASVLLVWCHGFSSSVLSACRGRRPRRL